MYLSYNLKTLKFAALLFKTRKRNNSLEESDSKLEYLMAVLTEGDVSVLQADAQHSLHEECRFSQAELEAMAKSLDTQKTTEPLVHLHFGEGNVSLSPEELAILDKESE